MNPVWQPGFNMRTSLAAVLVGLFAWALFLSGITRPSYYVLDEELYVENAKALLAGVQDTCPAGPPLGRLLIAGGIAVVGDYPFGWRLPSSVFGALTLVGIFLLANLLLEDLALALTAAALYFFADRHDGYFSDGVCSVGNSGFHRGAEDEIPWSEEEARFTGRERAIDWPGLRMQMEWRGRIVRDRRNRRFSFPVAQENKESGNRAVRRASAGSWSPVVLSRLPVASSARLCFDVLALQPHAPPAVFLRSGDGHECLHLEKSPDDFWKPAGNTVLVSLAVSYATLSAAFLSRFELVHHLGGICGICLLPAAIRSQLA